MIISEKRFNEIFNFFLLLIATTMIFRKPCTWIIICFVLFCLIFIKRLKYPKKGLLLGMLIASPFLLELIMFWNNQSYYLGLKSLEKSISLFVFPLFIIGHYKKIDFYKLLKTYTMLTTIIILFYFVRFVVVYPELLKKYLNGVDLWEMGYVFSNTIGIHAPALNMHLAFVAFSNLFFFIKSVNGRNDLIVKIFFLINFILSFFFVLFVNTRMALLCMIIGFIIVFFMEFFKEKNYKKVITTTTIVSVLSLTVFFLFLEKNTFMKEKYTTAMFSYMDKIGKLDEIDHPEIEVYSSLVTRLSIWKSVWELSIENLPFGVGASDGKPELFKYYKTTNQKFLANYQFPTHNQYLDFLLKFGILGLITIFLYVLTIGYIGYITKNAIIISFFLLFFVSNLTDDFLIRFDGIAFSGFWISIFSCHLLQQPSNK